MPFGDSIFRCTTKDRGERRASSSQAPHPSFCLSGQKLSRSAAPPLPTKPTSLGFGGAPIGGPLESPGINVDSKPDVLCAYVFPPGDFLRARNGACDAIKSAAACTSALLPQPLRTAFYLNFLQDFSIFFEKSLTSLPVFDKLYGPNVLQWQHPRIADPGAVTARRAVGKPI